MEHKVYDKGDEIVLNVGAIFGSRASMRLDKETGMFSLSMPGWFSPDMHPLSAYRVSRKYFENWDEFYDTFKLYKIDMPDLMAPPSYTLTDALFILFGGRAGLRASEDWMLDDIVEFCRQDVEEGLSESVDECVDYYYDDYDQDDMIEYVWLDIFGEDYTIAGIADFIDSEDMVSYVYESISDYIYDMK